jgi:hypothetical protein
VPKKEIVPEVSLNIPAMQRAMVDLPQPDLAYEQTLSSDLKAHVLDRMHDAAGSPDSSRTTPASKCRSAWSRGFDGEDRSELSGTLTASS